MVQCRELGKKVDRGGAIVLEKGTTLTGESSTIWGVKWGSPVQLIRASTFGRIISKILITRQVTWKWTGRGCVFSKVPEKQRIKAGL